MPPRLLRLPLVVLDQRVQLLDHRRDLVGHAAVDPVRLARAHPRDLLAHLAQRP